MQYIFSFLAVARKPSFAQLLFYLSTVSVSVCLFQVDVGTMLYRIDSDAHLETRARKTTAEMVWRDELTTIYRSD